MQPDVMFSPLRNFRGGSKEYIAKTPLKRAFGIYLASAGLVFTAATRLLWSLV